MNLVCQGIEKSYGSVKALQAADLTVHSGEVRAILGGNGSGKSTLAKILGGSVKKDRGEILVDGASFHPGSPGDSKRRGIIITSQELSLLYNLSVAENLSLCQLPTKGIFTDQRGVKQAATAMLERYGLLRLQNRRILELPPNEQYLVEFFKALMQRPKVLIIDEITSALYTKDVELVRRIIGELKEEGCAVLFISHRLSEIFSICDTVTVMRNGRTVVTYPVSETTEDQLLAQMAGKEAQEIQEDKALIRHAKPYEPGERQVLLRLRDFKVKGFDSRIDLDVYEGEVVGIAGLQGHGQSSLVRQLFGLYKPVRVELKGQPVTVGHIGQAVKRGIGFISGDRESEGTFSEQSLADNISTVSRMVFGRPEGSADDKLRQNNVVYATPRQKITELSGGNQQKVVIGRWTSTEPALLLADDPTKGIDVNARSDVHRILYGLADKGSAVMMVSSDDYELVTLAEHAGFAKIIVMYEGRITKVLTGSEINVDNIAAASLDAQGTEVVK